MAGLVWLPRWSSYKKQKQKALPSDVLLLKIQNGFDENEWFPEHNFCLTNRNACLISEGDWLVTILQCHKICHFYKNVTVCFKI